MHIGIPLVVLLLMFIHAAVPKARTHPPRVTPSAQPRRRRCWCWRNWRPVLSRADRPRQRGASCCSSTGSTQPTALFDLWPFGAAGRLVGAPARGCSPCCLAAAHGGEGRRVQRDPPSSLDAAAGGARAGETMLEAGLRQEILALPTSAQRRLRQCMCGAARRGRPRHLPARCALPSAARPGRTLMCCAAACRTSTSPVETARARAKL